MDETALTRGEQTRLAILDAAARLFLNNGYHGTSMRQIADGCGIAVGGIYNHFKGKEDIFTALIKTRSPYPEVIATLNAIPDSNGPQMVSEAFIAGAEIMDRNLDFVALVQIDIREFDGRTIRDLVTGVALPVLGFAIRAQRAGGIRTDVAPASFIRFYAGVLLGYVMSEHFLQGLPLSVPFLPAGERGRDEVILLLIDGMRDPAERKDADS